MSFIVIMAFIETIKLQGQSNICSVIVIFPIWKREVETTKEFIENSMSFIVIMRFIETTTTLGTVKYLIGELLRY